MKEIVAPLMDWYQKNKRDLPWRREHCAYHVWLSEIMLQQTRVEAVKGYYARFLAAIPDIETLAQVPEDELMKLWQGLGYYNRARNLQKAARILVEQYPGELPQTFEEWLSLPGIGEYTAGAIVSIALGGKKPAVDGNVFRIYTRLHGDDSDITRIPFRRKVTNEIQEILPEAAGDFNQALMDLGATVCIPNGKPLCESCPLKNFCVAHREGKETKYPCKKEKKARKIQKKTIFLVEYQGKYMLQKRPDKGLLAGLWEFPSQEGHLSIKELTQYLGVDGVDTTTDSVELLGKAKHIFSHVEWHMIGYAISLTTIPRQWQDSGIFVTKEEMEERYGIPSAFSYYYKKLK